MSSPRGWRDRDGCPQEFFQVIVNGSDRKSYRTSPDATCRGETVADDLRRGTCCQCFGIVWWSGVTGLVIGARAEDVEGIAGFHEGPLPPGWVGLLQYRPGLPPIEVVRDVLRDEATAPLRAYRASGATVYRPGGSGVADSGNPPSTGAAPGARYDEGCFHPRDAGRDASS